MAHKWRANSIYQWPGKKGQVKGKGGAAGFAKGGASVRLEEDGDTTVLHYEVEAKVGGKLAQLGSRIIDGFAKKMADQFFANFQKAVGAPGDPQEDPNTKVTGKEKSWLKIVFG